MNLGGIWAFMVDSPILSVTGGLLAALGAMFHLYVTKTLRMHMSYQVTLTPLTTCEYPSRIKTQGKILSVSQRNFVASEWKQKQKELGISAARK
jgi:hypothetical protein